MKYIVDPVLVASHVLVIKSEEPLKYVANTFDTFLNAVSRFLLEGREKGREKVSLDFNGQHFELYLMCKFDAENLSRRGEVTLLRFENLMLPCIFKEPKQWMLKENTTATYTCLSDIALGTHFEDVMARLPATTKVNIQHMSRAPNEITLIVDDDGLVHHVYKGVSK